MYNLIDNQVKSKSDELDISGVNNSRIDSWNFNWFRTKKIRLYKSLISAYWFVPIHAVF